MIDWLERIAEPEESWICASLHDGVTFLGRWADLWWDLPVDQMHDIAFYRSRWHGLPVENEGRAFEAFDACTHDKGHYLEYPGEGEMLHRSPQSTAPAIQFTRPKLQGWRSACITPNPETQQHLYDL